MGGSSKLGRGGYHFKDHTVIIDPPEQGREANPLRRLRTCSPFSPTPKDPYDHSDMFDKKEEEK